MSNRLLAPEYLCISELELSLEVSSIQSPIFLIMYPYQISEIRENNFPSLPVSRREMFKLK